MGDDILATPGMLQAHVDRHAAHGEEAYGTLGHVTWSPEIEITPFMRWLEAGGPQFHYWRIDDPLAVDPHQFFYTANVSVRRSFLIDNDLRFDEDFSKAACEDTELGHRMRAKGLRLEYLPEAVGYHEHYTSLASSCRRMIVVGESQELLREKLGSAEPARANASLAARLRLSAELVWRHLLARANYVPARFFEKRRLAEKPFRRVTKHFQRVGALRARLAKARA
jgi:GT2 family glycosyltransferase